MSVVTMKQEGGYMIQFAYLLGKHKQEVVAYFNKTSDFLWWDAIKTDDPPVELLRVLCWFDDSTIAVLDWHDDILISFTFDLAPENVRPGEDYDSLDDDGFDIYCPISLMTYASRLDTAEKIIDTYGPPDLLREYNDAKSLYYIILHDKYVCFHFNKFGVMWLLQTGLVEYCKELSRRC